MRRLKGYRAKSLVDNLLAYGIVLLLVSMIFHHYVVFWMAVILLSLGIYPRLYLHHIKKHFHFSNAKEKLHLYPGDSGELRLEMTNGSKLPIISAHIQFSIKNHIRITGLNTRAEHHYEFDLNIEPGKTECIILPVEAVSRGIARFKQFKIKLVDPLHIASTTIKFDFVRKEVVVFPKMKTLNGLNNLFLPKEGRNPHQKSLFPDTMAAIGTREYHFSDPLKHIHWKASAKTGKLQTKIFEKTLALTWSFVILLDLNMKKQAIEELEDKLSYVSMACREAEKRGIDVELFINTIHIDSANIRRLAPNHERIHYFKAMECLAMIQFNQLITNVDGALHEMDRYFKEPRVIMMIDQTSIGAKNQYYLKWKKSGHHVYSIHPQGFLETISAGGLSNAN